METNNYTSRLRKLCLRIIWGSSLILVSGLTLLTCQYACEKDPAPPIQFATYEVNLLYHQIMNSGHEDTELIIQGFKQFANTPAYLGPDNDKGPAYSGNHLSCANCHLHGGTKAYAAPLIGVVQRFPQYRGREDKMGTIEERINGCFERSMNGRMLDADGEEMEAFVAYLNWLGRNSDGTHAEKGFVTIEIPERAVDLDHGKVVFDTKCSICHGTEGQGKRGQNGLFYQYPPLWGPDSYNNGAGMTRVLTAARFIKGNMPYGATYDNPILTDEEAYDVAGYINQRPRPVKENLPIDFPNKLKKPVSTPYPPYVDSFPVEQHQLGPFQPIMEYYLKEHGVQKTK